MLPNEVLLPLQLLMMCYQIATQKSQGEEKLRSTRKKRIEKIQKKMSECERMHQERSLVSHVSFTCRFCLLSSFSRDQLRPMVDRLRELLERKRSLEAKQDEHFQQVTSAMKATVDQLNVAIHDRCDQLAEQD